MTRRLDPPPVTLVMIEDSPMDAEIVVRSLRRLGLVNTIVLLKDGVKALDYLVGAPRKGEGASHPVDLVLLDLNLPKVSGWEVIEAVRSHEATMSLPIVVMTSTEWDEERVRALDDPLTVTAPKPLDLPGLLKALRPLRRFSVVLVPRVDQDVSASLAPK